ncbi:unnamed protein product [Arabis nemorensis]|uniref:Uncharacterized protein n=1 Tax=Arabis nemorensis TaxID=586526 RepID=A0A565BKB0_9BRAS|nr:unnamed protein product [Arabis nemorensis]
MSLSRRCSSGDLAAHPSYLVLLLSSFTGETRLHSPTVVIDSVQMLVSLPPPSAATNHTKLLNFLAWRWKILARVLRSLRPPNPPDPLVPPDSSFPSPPPSSISVGRSFSVATPMVLEPPSERSSLAGFGFTGKTLPLDNQSTLHHRRFIPKISLDLNGTRSKSSDSYRRLVPPSPSYVSLRSQARDSLSQCYGRRLKNPSSNPSLRARLTLSSSSNLPFPLTGHDPRSNKGGDEALIPNVPSSFLVVAWSKDSPSAILRYAGFHALITITNFGLGTSKFSGFSNPVIYSRWKSSIPPFVSLRLVVSSSLSWRVVESPEHYVGIFKVTLESNYPETLRSCREDSLDASESRLGFAVHLLR